MKRWMLTMATLYPSPPSPAAAVLSGGTSGKGDACEGRSPHGFNGIESEVATGVARFVRGEKYERPSGAGAAGAQ
jgi:hypothetical protein